jgi:outer membrane protein assembly factor BamB
VVNNVGTPLIADGRVFVAYTTYAGNVLAALSLDRGRTLWKRKVSGGAAYDSGRVFATDRNGDVIALNPADGRLLWRSKSVRVAGSMLAAGGEVYASTDEGIVALDPTNGAERWRGTTGSGGGLVSRAGDRVFAQDRCHGISAFEAGSGKRLWDMQGGCSGPFSFLFLMPVVHQDRIYRSLFTRVYDAANGQQTGRFPASRPAFAGDAAVIVDARGVSEIPASGGEPRWTYRGRRREWKDGVYRAARPAVVTRFNAYALSTRARLVVLDRENGREVQEGTLDGLPESYGLVSDGAANLAAAQGTLVVPVRGTLHALGSLLSPPPRGVDAVALNPYTVFAQRFELAAGVGRELRDGRPRVRIEFDRYPYRRWTAGSAHQTRPEGVAYFDSRPTRNTRFRARLESDPRIVSPTVYAYVYPRIGVSIRAVSASYARVAFRVRGPKEIRLGGKRIFLYLLRHGSSRLVRLAGATLRSTGRGRAAASARFRRYSGAHPADDVYYCVRGIENQGFGKRDRFARGCGRRVVGF